MSAHEQRPPSSGDPRPHSPVSIISGFSDEGNRDSNNGESPQSARKSRASRGSSISASSQLSTNHIGLVRPLSAAMISSNDRFTSSVTSDQPRGNGFDSTEQVFSFEKSTMKTEPYNQNETESDRKRRRAMWNPFWLWRTTLIGFILAFALLVIILVILYHFSKVHHGLGTQIPRNHYGWTYGPTAGGFILRQDVSPNAY